MLKVTDSVRNLTERHWERLLGAAIPVAWIWFALLGIKWNLLLSLFIAIAVTILFGTLYSVLEGPEQEKK